MRQMRMIHSRIDPLHGRPFIVIASPLVRVWRQLTEIAKMLRVNLDSHRAGLGAGFDLTPVIAGLPTLAGEIIHRRRTGPLECAALLFPALIMHWTNLLGFGTLAIQHAVLRVQDGIQPVGCIERPGRHLEPVRMRVLIPPHPAAVDHRQYVFVEQALANPVAVKPAVGHKALAALIEPQLLALLDQLLAVHIFGLIGRCQPIPDRQLVPDIPVHMQGVTLGKALHRATTLSFPI